jgi:hypothetical protein
MGLPLIRWITKAVFAELIGELKLYDYPQDPTSDIPMIQTIQPVYDIWSPVTGGVATSVEGKILSNAALDLTGSTSTHYPAFAVPTGRRWHVLEIWIYATTANSHLTAYDNSEAVVHRLEAAAALTTRNIADVDIWLEELDSLGSLGTGNGADNAAYITAIVEEHTVV